MRRTVLLFSVALTTLLLFSPGASAQDKKKQTPLWSDQKDNFGDPLPQGAIARIGTTRYRLSDANSLGAPGSLTISPDGKLLASLLPEGIEIWELPAWNRHKLINAARIDKDHPPRFVSIVFFPDGKKLAAYDGAGQTIHLLDLATGKSIKRLPIGKSTTPRLTVSSDTQTLICSFIVNLENGTAHDIQVWDHAREKRTQSFQISSDGVSGLPEVAITANGRLMIENVPGGGLARGNGKIRPIEIRDLTTGKPARTIETDTALPIRAISPDGKWLACSNGQNLLRIYDAVSGKEKLNIRLRNSGIQYLKFAPDSASLYAADDDAKITVWDPARGERLASHAMPAETTGVDAFRFPPGGKVLAFGGDADAIHCWEVATGKLLSPTGVPEAAIAGVGFAPQGELFVASYDGKVAWWNPRTGAKRSDLKLDAEENALPVRGRSIAVPIAYGRSAFRRASLNGIGLGFDLTAILSKNGEILCADEGGGPLFFDAKTGKLLFEEERDNGIRAVFLDDGRKIASIEGRKIRIWNPRTGRDLERFDVPLRDKERANEWSASASGSYFAINTGTDEGDGGRTILWDAALKKIVREWSEEDRASAMAFSPDHRWLALAAAEKRLLLTRVGSAKGEFKLPLPGASKEITLLAFSPDGRQLACTAGMPARDRDLDRPMVVRDPDPETKNDSRIFIYEVASKKIRLELVGHADGTIACLAYARDSGLLASGATDTTALIWRAGLPAFAELPAGKDVTQDELASRFKSMGDADAKAAFQSMIQLAQTPAQTVKLLDARIAPAKKPDTGGKTAADWIHDLGSSQFAVRTKANTMLQKIGASVEPELRVALPKAQDVETKHRIEELLEYFASYQWKPEEIAHARAVEVMEAIATPEARALLTRWSGGDAGAVLTTEARQALARLDRMVKSEK